MERRLWNPSLPQTLLVSVFLLYANAVTALLFRAGDEGLFALMLFGVIGSLDLSSTLGTLLSILHVVGSVAAGVLIASERRIGWKIGVVVAAAPVVARAVCLATGTIPFARLLSIDLLFDAALLALLLHPQSRDHQRVWFG